ncbi:uncharacterized protein LOC113225724 [Hyposmocoma kahamanoa]|uniref:uncharacterized protein LOC113225724 n=1 Tax=Hyposmocoma kahamanoa TaxID=1477025 RepID=UPI000E6D615D|nr:uncharacterized protein LOC113225724 [Hyposmocoma kahamanoa]
MDDTMKKMEDAFKALKASGQNTATGITDWLKRAAIITDEETERKAKELLGEGKVTYEKFNAAVKKLAQDKKAKFDDYSKKLLDSVSTAANDAKGTVEQEAESFKDAVAKFKADTSNFLHAGTSTLNETVNEQKTKVVEAAKNVFSIFSPSEK